LPATPTILALSTATDWRQLPQYPTSAVLVDGSNDRAAEVRLLHIEIVLAFAAI
jgi:hypothetical protein